MKLLKYALFLSKKGKPGYVLIDMGTEEEINKLRNNRINEQDVFFHTGVSEDEGKTFIVDGTQKVKMKPASLRDALNLLLPCTIIFVLGMFLSAYFRQENYVSVMHLESKRGGYVLVPIEEQFLPAYEIRFHDSTNKFYLYSGGDHLIGVCEYDNLNIDSLMRADLKLNE